MSYFIIALLESNHDREECVWTRVLNSSNQGSAFNFNQAIKQLENQENILLAVQGQIESNQKFIIVVYLENKFLDCHRKRSSGHSKEVNKKSSHLTMFNKTSLLKDNLFNKSISSSASDNSYITCFYENGQQFTVKSTYVFPSKNQKGAKVAEP